MILISHRGNINGKSISKENNPNYIDIALNHGFDVEIDVWNINGNILLGHDQSEYFIEIDWLEKRKNKLWIHCKNFESVEYMSNTNFNFFWHQNDDMTITSKKYIWMYPGKQPIQNSIAVLPEKYNIDTSICYGICSDYIGKYNENI